MGKSALLSLRIQFRGKAVFALGLLLLSFMLLKLGFWQLDRGEQKRQAQITSSQRSQSTPAALDTLPLRPAGDQWYLSNDKLREVRDLLQWRNVSLKGRYIPEKTFLINGHFFQGRVGYEVITPFLMENPSMVVMVSRGWLVAQPRDVNKVVYLPESPVVTDEMIIVGTIHVPMIPSVVSSEVAVNLSEENPWPLELYRPSINFMSQYFDEPVLAYIVRLKEGEVGMYSKHWKQEHFSDSSHLSYAFQWFVLSIITFIIMLVMSTNIIDVVKVTRS